MYCRFVLWKWYGSVRGLCVSQKPSDFIPSYFNVLMIIDIFVCVVATRLSECK
jgi:hypothetical protein